MAPQFRASSGRGREQGNACAQIQYSTSADYANLVQCMQVLMMQNTFIYWHMHGHYANTTLTRHINIINSILS